MKWVIQCLIWISLVEIYILISSSSSSSSSSVFFETFFCLALSMRNLSVVFITSSNFEFLGRILRFVNRITISKLTGMAITAEITPIAIETLVTLTVPSLNIMFSSLGSMLVRQLKEMMLLSIVVKSTVSTEVKRCTRENLERAGFVMTENHRCPSTRLFVDRVQNTCWNPRSSSRPDTGIIRSTFVNK